MKDIIRAGLQVLFMSSLPIIGTLLLISQTWTYKTSYHNMPTHWVCWEDTSHCGIPIDQSSRFLSVERAKGFKNVKFIASIKSDSLVIMLSK